MVLPTVNGAGLKHKGQRGGGGGEGALQTQNGQGDTLSQSSSILQVGPERGCALSLVLYLRAVALTYAGVGSAANVGSDVMQLYTARHPYSRAQPPANTHTHTNHLLSHPAQDNWEAVLELATDTTPSAPGSALSPPGSGGDLAPGTHVRRRVVELMEIVLR